MKVLLYIALSNCLPEDASVHILIKITITIILLISFSFIFDVDKL